MDDDSQLQKSTENVEKLELSNVFNTMKELDNIITNTLRTVNTVSSNLLDEIEFVVHEHKSDNSLPIERQSAKVLINIKEESVQLINHFAELANPQLDEALNFSPVYKYVEDVERFSEECNEFNRYLKMISQGIKKMVSNNKNQNIDNSQQGSLNSTFLSADFSLGNPVASSPFVSPRAKHNSQ
ncbi:uncharacterized protein [Leptinotarsa decemlineata]|uniref:uncharacterized protein n=1 Tax=Leptinotarsa decemlineata TaxID=7539 RepID=UPI003D309569